MISRATLLLLPLASLAHADLDWGQTAKLIAGDQAHDDEYGRTVAIDGDLAVIGAWQDDDNGQDSGSAYVVDVQTGQQLHKLLPNNGAQGHNFGRTVDISGQVVIVGSNGSAYLFDAQTGQQLIELAPLDGLIPRFGWEVAIDGGLCVVGAEADDFNGQYSGSAYVFDVGTGAQVHKLLPLDATNNDWFGSSVDIDGTLVLVGKLGDNEVNGSGAAYLFDASSGAQRFKLTAAGGQPGDSLGTNAALHDGIAVFGVPYREDNGVYSGAAYLFDTTTGQEIMMLQPADNEIGDRFGQDVAIHDDFVVVGAWGDDDEGDRAGAAYVYDRSGTLLAKLLAEEAPNQSEIDWLGYSVAVHGDTALIGAPLDNVVDFDSGAVFVFRRSELPNIGVTYCSPANANSTGLPAQLTAHGSEFVSLDCVRLLASQVPMNQWGYFLNSTQPGVSTPPGSSGILCLSGPIGRHSQFVQNSGLDGAFHLDLDLSQLPRPGGTVAVQPGESWFFQAWFRDSDPSPTSNFTDGILVTFQ